MDAHRRVRAAMNGARVGARVGGQPRILLARDPRLSTCDALVRGLEREGGVEVTDVASVEGARAWIVERTFDLCLVCLDLPPAPRGGARLAKELVRRGYPVVFITRSLRWLPAEDGELRNLRWVIPDADPVSVLALLPDDAPSHVRPIVHERASSPDLA
jgi:hypothetical protein